MKEPSVSIVLLNWNNFEETRECLESVEELDYGNFDTWILDNGSMDDSAEKLKKLKTKGLHLVLSKINRGFAEGNNFLVGKILKTKKPDYLLILNNDTIFPKDLLSKLVKTARDKGASVVGPKLIFPNGKEIASFCKMDKFLCDSEWEIPDKKNKIIETDSVCGCCMLIKTEDYLRFKGFKKDYFIYNEETDLCFRMMKKGRKIFLDLRTKLIHKEGASFKKEGKVSLYYHTRNQFLLRRDHYGKIKYCLFVFRYLFVQFWKKNIYLTITRQMDMIPVYLMGVIHGLFNLRGKRM